MNDMKASELISQSLLGELDPREQSELQGYLEVTPEAKSFANLSALIQKSMLEMAHSDVLPTDAEETVSGATSGERLNELAKERMRRKLRKAYSSSVTDYGARSMRVAEAETAYYRVSQAETRDAGEESRQAVARFTLLRKIGEGGLGTVWLARDEKLRRNVALKELNTSSSESLKLWKRFAREAEITGHLEHPNVVPLYMSGVNPETERPFYAMRFLGKQTLADAIAEYHAQRGTASDDPIHLHRLLNAFLDVCQAIAFAHSRGVIHRDLKPENVALDNFGQVLVLDWGLAKLDTDGELATRLALSGSQEEGSVAQTLDGDVVGTPLYMAPEQAAGDMQQLDERTDVYGLGAILFAILTGRAPHEKSLRAQGEQVQLKEALESISQAETPRPRDIDPLIPRDLEAICLRAMSRQRFARHASAQDLASEVESWIAGRHRMQARYDSMRMTGRDLKSRLCVQARQLAVTAQFMVELPPIQGLLASLNADPEEYNSWRERLSTILLALARTKSNLSGLSYAQVTEDRIHELVRVERSLHDVSNIRTLPQSRLRRGAATTFHKTVMEQFPGEFCIDFDLSTAGVVRIVTGVPVFDAKTEEPFGLVLAEAEIGNLVRPEIEAIETRDTIYLIDDKERILFSTRPANRDAFGLAAEEIPRWPEIAQGIAQSPEYIESDREFYATRLMFPQKNNSIRIVLQVAE
jgi:serine/threonine protein kinase